MHKSAEITGKLFLDNYWSSSFSKILEIGSYDVNGSLRRYQPIGSEWLGVDIEMGPGVDVVIESSTRLPFADETFDVIVASSVFEHDSIFWKTFEEMVRVCRKGGYLYISAPSNGKVHRYPRDAWRFYPDAGIALAEFGSMHKMEFKLVESFIGRQDEDMWNDFVAVFTVQGNQPKNFISDTVKHNNLWKNGCFVAGTATELTEDQEQIAQYDQMLSRVALEKISLEIRLFEIVNSTSWKLTKPVRICSVLLKRLLRRLG